MMQLIRIQASAEHDSRDSRANSQEIRPLLKGRRRNLREYERELRYEHHSDDLNSNKTKLHFDYEHINESSFELRI